MGAALLCKSWLCAVAMAMGPEVMSAAAAQRLCDLRLTGWDCKLFFNVQNLLELGKADISGSLWRNRLLSGPLLTPWPGCWMWEQACAGQPSSAEPPSKGLRLVLTPEARAHLVPETSSSSFLFGAKSMHAFLFMPQLLV